jgi:putative FmdB family regulatory protein
MPIYAFVCGKCHHEFEELLPMGKSAPCPKCASADVQKQVTAAAFNGAAASNSSPAPRATGGGSCGSGCGCH